MTEAKQENQIEVIDYTKLIVPDDFCTVRNSNLEDYNVKKGDLVFVVGMRPLPVEHDAIKPDDLYTHVVRMYATVARTDETGLPIFPDSDSDVDQQMLLVSPDSLKKVSKKKQEKYFAQVKAEYGEIEEEDEDGDDTDEEGPTLN